MSDLERVVLEATPGAFSEEWEINKANAAYVAAVTPDVVLALLKIAEAAKALIDFPPAYNGRTRGAYMKRTQTLRTALDEWDSQ